MKSALKTSRALFQMMRAQFSVTPELVRVTLQKLRAVWQKSVPSRVKRPTRISPTKVRHAMKAAKRPSVKKGPRLRKRASPSKSAKARGHH